MKITKTDIDMKVNASSSWAIFVSKSYEEAKAIEQVVRAFARSTILGNKDGYCRASINEIITDCRVPSFFHNRGYWICSVEHNNGSWENEQTYALYIVE